MLRNQDVAMKRISLIFAIGVALIVWQSYTLTDPAGWKEKMEEHYLSARYDSTIFYVTQLQKEYRKIKNIEAEFGLMSHHSRSEAALSGNEKARITLNQYKDLYNTYFKGDSVKYAEILEEEAYLFFDINEFNAAVSLAQRALNIKLRYLSPSDSLLAKTYALLGNLHYFTEQNEKAFDYHTKSIEIKKKVFSQDHISTAISYVQRAITRTDHRDSMKSDYNKAIEMATKSGGPEHRINLASYNNLSSIYYEEGTLDSFLLFLNKAIDINLKLNNETSLAINYINKARYLQVIGDLETAMQLSRLAEAIFRKDSERNSHFLTNVYDQLGSGYDYLGRLDDAFSNYQKAGALKMKLYGPNSMAMALYYYNIANIYNSHKDYKEAIKLLNKVLDIAHINGAEDDILVPNAFADLSKTFKEMHDWDQALKNASKAIKLYKQKNGPHHKYTLESELDVAEVHYLQGKYDLALKETQEAIAYSFQPYWNYTTLLDNPENYHEMLPFLAGRMMHLKATILYKKGLAENQFSLLNAAKDALKIGLHLQNNRYMSVGSMRNQKELLNNLDKDFELLTDITISQFQSDRDTRHLSELFTYAEDRKSFNLRDALRGEQAASFNGVPDSLIDRERLLSQMIHLYLQQKQEDNSPDWDKKYTEWKQEYDSIIGYIKENFPDYASIRYDISSINLEQTQNLLDKYTGIYRVLVGSDQYYSLYITEDTAILQELGPIHMIQGCLEEMHQHMQKDDCRQFAGNSHFLYKLLFEKIEVNLLEKLIWVPDLHFHSLNPEILVTHASDKLNTICLFEEQFFFIRDVEIWVSHSITTLMRNSPPPGSEYWSAGIAGFAPFDHNSVISDCTLEDGGKMIRLPWAAKALKEMKNTYYGIFLSGKEVEKKKVLHLMKEAAILHFGTHAITNNEKPLYSGLVMGCKEDSGRSTYDFITAADLYGMRIPARLTVLTACQTGSGKFESGEGVISLAHAFHYAGCPSTLMTLWSVDDQTSSSISLTFYQNLKQGLSFSESLRNAKMEYLSHHKGSMPNPVYWGGLVLIGENKSWIPESYPIRKIWITWSFLILIPLLLLLFVFKIKRNMAI